MLETAFKDDHLSAEHILSLEFARQVALQERTHVHDE